METTHTGSLVACANKDLQMVAGCQLQFLCAIDPAGVSVHMHVCMRQSEEQRSLQMQKPNKEQTMSVEWKVDWLDCLGCYA